MPESRNGSDHTRIAAYFPQELVDTWHCHAMLEICAALRTPELELTLTAHGVRANARRPFTRAAITPRLQRVAYRVHRQFPRLSFVETLGRLRYLWELRHASAAYLWAGVPRAIYEDVVRARLPLFVERINCHRQTAKRILDEAYARAGVPPQHGITDAAVREETEKLAMADFIFAPSPPVRDSLLDAGVPASKILLSSYGYAPHRLSEGARPARAGKLVYLFLGTACVRKGTHLLLEAWARAQLDGKLMLCGLIAPEIEKLSKQHLQRADVEARGFVSDIRAVLAEADVLVLPTFEEGSPFVVYEAMAAGVVPLVTPMGAGELVRPDRDGLLVPTQDVDALAAAMTRLANDAELRAQLSASAAERAQHFTWDKVAARRRDLMLSALTRAIHAHHTQVSAHA